MIIQRMLIKGIKSVPQTWQITINTEATTAGEKKSAIPFNLYGQDNVALDVDWGDGNRSVLTSSDYGELDATASIHEYSDSGIYTISIKSKQWSSCYILAPHGASKETTNLPTTLNNAIEPLYWYQRTLIAAEAFPKFKGTNYYNRNTAPTSLQNRNNCAAHIFERCTKLTSIASKLFAQNNTTTIFVGTFEGCTSLASIPEDIFADVDGHNFGECFQGCFSLSEIPEDLFKDCVNATDLSETFCYCKTITSVPSGLFAHSHEITDFSACFMYCSQLETIPSALFAGQIMASNFNQCFSATKIAAIPSGFFDDCRKAQIFRRVFSDCPLLADIPDYLFKNCSLATSFIGSFGGYPSSGSIPNYNGISIHFSGANNTGIQSIPSTLFSGATSAELFQDTFHGCRSLQAIPSGLFDDNAAATDFSYCFASCSSVQEIPAGLFDNNGSAIYFSSCFKYCNLLEDIPVDLFVHNTAATMFDDCFYMASTNSLDGFSVRIGSGAASNVNNFVKLKTGVTRTIYVPSGSITETTFNAVATDLGLTIVGE